MTEQIITIASSSANFRQRYELRQKAIEQNNFAIAELQPKANEGDAQAQFDLALCYANVGIEKNIALAFEWHKKSAEQGLACAQLSLGFYYLLERPFTESAKKIATSGHELVYMNGLENTRTRITKAAYLAMQEWQEIKPSDVANYDLAFKWFEKAAEQGDAGAQYWLAICYNEGLGVEKNDDLVFAWHKKAAEQNMAESKYWLAHFYLEGKGITQNKELAVIWLFDAAEQAVPDAYLLLGHLYAEGKCIEKNDELAFKWYQKAAEEDGGNRVFDATEAFYRLAKYYLYGDIVKKDYKSGMDYLMRAVKANHAEAHQWLEETYLNLVFPYFSGRDNIEQCYKFAYDWLFSVQKENRDDFEINFSLGTLYAFGKGVEKNQELASKCFKACIYQCRDRNESLMAEEFKKFIAIFYKFSDFFCLNSEGDNRSYDYFDFLAPFFLKIERQSNAVLPLFRIAFHTQWEEFDLLIEFLNSFEKLNSSFSYLPSKKNFIHMGLTITKQAKELVEKNKALESEIKQKEAAYKALHEKEKEMLSFFTHTMRNALGTAPESLRQAIHLLGSEVYEKDTKHYQAINKIASLFSTLSLTDCLIDTFKQSISDPQEFKQCWHKDHAGEASPKWVIASALRQSLNRIIFMPDTAELRMLLGNPETALIKSTRKSFIEEVLPFNVDSQGVDVFYDWTLNHISAIEVSITDFDKLNFGVNQVRFSLLFAITSELILNALKYWDGKDCIQISWHLTEQSNYVFSVKNHCKANATSNLAGTHKGLAFIKRLVELLGEQAQFECKTEDQLFIAELILNKALFKGDV